jgi:hypothetical protein
MPEDVSMRRMTSTWCLTGWEFYVAIIIGFALNVWIGGPPCSKADGDRQALLARGPLE